MINVGVLFVVELLLWCKGWGFSTICIWLAGWKGRVRLTFAIYCFHAKRMNRLLGPRGYSSFMREFLLVFVLAVVVGSFVGVDCLNIFYIMLDDYAVYAIGVYGLYVNYTLNIDCLVREGVVFINVF